MAAFSRLKSDLDPVTGPRGAGSYYQEIAFRAILRRGFVSVRFIRAKREELASLCTVATNAVCAYPSFLTKRSFLFVTFYASCESE